MSDYLEGRPPATRPGMRFIVFGLANERFMSALGNPESAPSGTVR